jgi:hypothetical protein
MYTENKIDRTSNITNTAANINEQSNTELKKKSSTTSMTLKSLTFEIYLKKEENKIRTSQRK